MAAIAADDGSDSDDAICLVGNATDTDDISKSWLVDSAASAHMCWMRGCFDDYQTTTGRSVTMGDKGSVVTAGVGTVVLSVIVHGKTRKIKLEKVLRFPTMGFNLMSVGMMEKRGAEVSFKGVDQDLGRMPSRRRSTSRTASPAGRFPSARHLLSCGPGIIPT